LKVFEHLSEQHLFANEPDWEDALARFRADVVRGVPNPKSWDWCSEILGRVYHGRPPVTEEEFYTLEDWYERNKAAIRGGRLDYDPFVNAIPRGPRQTEVTKYVERLRELRARFPELE
jgi:hypothetical protein